MKHGLVLPTALPQTGWSLDQKGYVMYTSRKKDSPIKRGARAHREYMKIVVGRELTSEEVVHHQDFRKAHNCGTNLILMPRCFNPSSARRDPYTGEYMSVADWQRRYGGG